MRRVTRESTLAWIVWRWWFWALAVAILFAQPLVRTLLREKPVLPPVGAAVPAFEALRETGQPFGTRELGGRVWVASFVVADEADDTLEILRKLQRRLRHMGDSYRMVSFAAIPDQDDVARLAALARRAHANPRAWCFVTGTTLAPVAAALHVALGARPDPTLILIDQHGHIRWQYDPRNPAEVDSLVATLGLVVNAY